MNVLIFICQKIFLSDSIHVALLYGFNYQSIVGAHQFYRIITAAFSHQGIAHILFNMCALAVFSVSLEKAYGTCFFAAVNMWILAVCTAIQLLYAHARIFWLPISLGGGSVETLAVYAFGYSAILFGLIMLVSLTGDRNMNIYGCSFPKIVLPFVYLVFSQMIVANADWMGHLSGIIAALIVRYAGVYPARLLPQYTWLQSVENDLAGKTKRWHELLGYFCATDEIEKDFSCKL